MKIINIILLFLVAFAILFFYCFSTKTIEVSKNKFETEYQKSKNMQTMYSYQLLYKKNDNIFMLKKEMTFFFNKWRENILYTNFNHLSIKTQEEINKSLKNNR